MVFGAFEVSNALYRTIVFTEGSIELDAIPDARSKLSHADKTNDARLLIGEEYFTANSYIFRIDRRA